MISLSDGVDLMSGRRIVTGNLKATLEEVREPERIRVTIGGRPARELDLFCIDPS